MVALAENKILKSGGRYNADAETQNYYVRNRYYLPTLGRWLTRDPIGYQGGINLYEYVQSSPVGNVDGEGLWRISRKGKATAVAISQAGDTIAGLAGEIHLNPAEWKKWSKVVSGNAPSSPSQHLNAGCLKLAVPNTVVVDVGWSLTHNNRGNISAPSMVSIMGAFLRDAFESQTSARAAGFMVSFDGAATDRGIVTDLNTYSKRRELYAFYYFGHGAALGYLVPGNKFRSMLVAPARYTAYGIALMALYACSSAAPQNPTQPEPIRYVGANGAPASILTSQPGGTEWRLNVAPGGKFGGYTAAVNIFDEGWFWSSWGGLAASRRTHLGASVKMEVIPCGRFIYLCAGWVPAKRGFSLNGLASFYTSSSAGLCSGVTA